MKPKSYLELKGLIEERVILVLSCSACPLFSAVRWDAVQFQNYIGVNELSFSPRSLRLGQVVGTNNLRMRQKWTGLVRVRHLST